MALHHGINTTRFRTYAELKAVYPNQPDGVYALFPNGPSGAASIAHCITYEGEYYQAVFAQCGGPRYTNFAASNVSNQVLHDNYTSYDGIIQPFDVDGQMYSRMNANGYEFWTQQSNVKWYKRIRSYDSNAALITNGSYSFDLTMELDANLTFADIWGSAASSQLPGYATMTVNNQPYGSTRYTACYGDWNSTRGLANALNGDDSCVPAGEPVVDGYIARHFLSYVHTSNGYNATRCQGVCWSGSEDAAMEHIWYVKFSNE